MIKRNPISPKPLLILLLTAFSAFSFGLNKADLATQLDRLVKSNNLNGASLAVAVYDPADTSLVYGHNASRQMVPASLQKLVTAVGALQALGPEHRFQTWIGCSGEIRDSLLLGDLVIRGGGDPSWIEEVYPEGPHKVFELWADSLLALGIKAIQGDLAADLSYGPTVAYNQHWDEEDSLWGYTPSLSALSFNCNFVRYDLKGNARKGFPASIAPRFGYTWHQVKNQVRTTRKGSGASLWLEKAADRNQIILKGTLGAGAEDFLNAAVRDPARFTLQNIAAVFRQKGIEISGRNVLQASPREDLPLQPLFVFDSVELARVLPAMLKGSVNFVAESVLYALAPGYQQALDTLSIALKYQAVFPDYFRIVDGCGLARDNRNTASNLGILLCHAHSQQWFPTFLGALATPGEPGTLQKRFPRQGKEPRIFGKTGTMTGISNLAGYFRAADGKLYAFVIQCNKVGSVAAAQRWQEEIVNRLLQYDGT